MMERFGIILLVIGLTGCLGGGASSPYVRQYILEYPPPSVEQVHKTDAVLKVERFTVDRSYIGPSMLYRQGAFRRDAYQGKRWRVAPGDMVTDFLRRDIRHSSLFRAVIPSRDPEDARFLLEGGLEDFLEVGEGERRKALLVATVTLLDLSAQDVSGRVIFQKTYQCEAPFAKDGEADFAEAMSRAMSQLSARMITDIGQAVKKVGP